MFGEPLPSRIPFLHSDFEPRGVLDKSLTEIWIAQSSVKGTLHGFAGSPMGPPRPTHGDQKNFSQRDFLPRAPELDYSQVLECFRRDGKRRSGVFELKQNIVFVTCNFAFDTVRFAKEIWQF
jgi:hypothetical protein